MSQMIRKIYFLLLFCMISAAIVAQRDVRFEVETDAQPLPEVGQTVEPVRVGPFDVDRQDRPLVPLRDGDEALLPLRIPDVVPPLARAHAGRKLE